MITLFTLPLIYDLDHHMSLQNRTLIVLFMDRFYLHQDSRDYKSSLIICPVQFNLSLLSSASSAFYFPWILTSVLIFLKCCKAAVSFSTRRLKVQSEKLITSPRFLPVGNSVGIGPGNKPGMLLFLPNYKALQKYKHSSLIPNK